MAKKQEDFFTRFTSRTSTLLGRPVVFISALIVLLLWGISGPLLGFSDTWQLVINTGTTIITFLMVFIIQNTQNRDSLAVNIKLDALLKSQGLTREDLLEAEDKSDSYLEKEKAREQNQSKKTAASKASPKST